MSIVIDRQCLNCNASPEHLYVTERHTTRGHGDSYTELEVKCRACGWRFFPPVKELMGFYYDMTHDGIALGYNNDPSKQAAYLAEARKTNEERIRKRDEAERIRKLTGE